MHNKKFGWEYSQCLSLNHTFLPNDNLSEFHTTSQQTHKNRQNTQMFAFITFNRVNKSTK
jgi:hypothetical protein